MWYSKHLFGFVRARLFHGRLASCLETTFIIHSAKLMLRVQAHQIHLTIVHVKPQVCLEKIENKYETSKVSAGLFKISSMFNVNMYEGE